MKRYKIPVDETCTFRHTITIEVANDTETDELFDYVERQSENINEAIGSLREKGVKILDQVFDSSGNGEIEIDEYEEIDEEGGLD